MRPTRKLQAIRPDLTTVKTHSLAPLHVGERSGDEPAPVVALVSWGSICLPWPRRSQKGLAHA